MLAVTASRRKAAIAFILVTAMLDIVAMGIIIPVLPPLIEEFAGSNAARRLDQRRLRRALGRHAVRRLADHRLAVGPVRPPAGDPAVDRRAGRRLRADGAGAQSLVAGARPHHRRHHLVELHHRLRLHGRHHAAGRPRPRLRADRRGLQRRLRRRAAARRRARRDLAARAVLGRGRDERPRLPLRLLVLPESLAPRKAHGILLAPRQSVRRHGAAALASGTHRAGGGQLPAPLRPPRLLGGLRALRRLSATAGRRGRSARCWRWSALLDMAVQGAAGRPGRQALRRPRRPWCSACSAARSASPAWAWRPTA